MDKPGAKTYPLALYYILVIMSTLYFHNIEIILPKYTKENPYLGEVGDANVTSIRTPHRKEALHTSSIIQKWMEVVKWCAY